MITCPSCGTSVPDQDRCLACGYPIILRRGEQPPTQVQPQQGPPTQAYPQQSPPTQALPPQAYPQQGRPQPGPPGGAPAPFGSGVGGSDPYGANPFAPGPGAGPGAGPAPGAAYGQGSGGTAICPNPACRHPNPARRTLCELCGWYLRPQPVPEQPVAPVAAPPPTSAPSRSRRTPAVLAGVSAVLVAALISATYGLLHRGTGRVATPRVATTTTAPSPSSDGTYVVDPATVRAKASSTQKPDGGVSYVAANLLDGDPKTAWNSNGDKTGRGKGVVLRFTFDEPVDLRGVAVLNGYQKKAGGADLYARNGRVASFTVTTDSATKEWKLRDERAAQALEADLGRTRSVVLKVTGVYPGAKYQDLALSEISFLAKR